MMSKMNNQMKESTPIIVWTLIANLLTNRQILSGHHHIQGQTKGR
jgi:hypothetical protein